jgi:hypothetical protein
MTAGAATEFGTINSFFSFTGDLATGPVTLGAAGSEAGTTRFRAAVIADPATASTATGGTPVVVHENTEEGRYAAADLVVAPATTVDEYVFNNTKVTKSGTDTTVVSSRSEFLNNITATKVTATPALALTRTSYTGWIRTDTGANAQTRVTYGVWGYPTVASDMLTTGSATYTARIAGRVVGVAAGGTGTLTRLGGTVTITVNWATGLVTITANVTTVTGGVETPYGTFTGNGAIAAGATQFSGSFGPASPIPGTFNGTFFGPQGSEIGVAFAGSGTVGALDTRLAGVVVGKKN